MSEGNTKCKLFGNCTEFTIADKCTTGCDYYAPKNPDEEIEIPEEVMDAAEAEEEASRPTLKLLPSDLPKFDKLHEFFVMKKHVFTMQSVSPKKIILKYKRKLKDTDNLHDGCYIFRDREDNLLEPEKVFKSFDREKSESAKKKEEA